MEKSEKRTRLTEEQQRELVNDFILKQGSNPFTVGDFKNYLTRFDWFKKLSDKAKDNRSNRYLYIMRDILGGRLKTTPCYSGGHKAPNSYVISDKEGVAEEKSAATPKPKRRCSEETIRKFYLIMKRASESKVGISKKDVETIMGYKTSMTTSSVVNLNEYICKETGFRPFVIADSLFVDYDILRVDHETALLILDDLKEKIGSEPTMPEFEDFERVVKSIIRRDYFALSMFKNNNTIQNTTGDIQQFKEFVVGKKKSAYIGYDKICEIFYHNLEKRYKLSENGIDIRFSSRFRKHITILDTSGNPEIRKALDRIASVYAEYFCENIVESEKKILEVEDNTTLREKSRLEIIETLFFKNKSGEMFLSDLWKKFDETDTPRGWDLLGLLRKYPEKFRIERFANKSNGGYSEDKIIYTAPKEEESEVDQLAAQEEEIQKDIKPNPETINDTVVDDVSGKGTKKRVLEATIGFKEYSEKPSVFLNPGEVMMFDTYYYMYKIEVDLDDKNSIFEFLKLYWTTGGKTILCDGELCDIEHELRELLVG